MVKRFDKTVKQIIKTVKNLDKMVKQIVNPVKFLCNYRSKILYAATFTYLKDM